MLVGPAGSGKSTCAGYLFDNSENGVIVSSDRIREELYGDESVQGDPSRVFNLCRSRCIDLLNKGNDVIFDATNLNRKKRKSFLNDIKNRTSVCIRYECVVVATTYEDCVLHNSQRERKVPEYVIYRHFSQFQMPLYSEGWDYIDVYRTSYTTLAVMLDRCKEISHDNIHHKYNVYEHLLQAEYCIIQNCSNKVTKENLSLLQALALWHDVGKAYTKVFHNKKGEPTEEAHFYNHECWSAMYCLCDPTYSTTDSVKLAQLVSLHMMKYQPEYETFLTRWAPEYQNLLELFNKADEESA